MPNVMESSNHILCHDYVHAVIVGEDGRVSYQLLELTDSYSPTP